MLGAELDPCLRDEVFDAGERVFSGQDEPLADSVEDFLHVGRQGLGHELELGGILCGCLGTAGFVVDEKDC